MAVTLGVGSSSQLLFNSRIVVFFKVQTPIRKGFPLAPLLFAVSSHSLISALESKADKGIIIGLALSNKDQLLVKMFADDSLLLLKVKACFLRNALQVIQVFALALGLQCNIEKSQMILLIEGSSFDPSNWNGKVINKGQVFWHLGASLGVDVSDKQRFEWIWERVQKS